MKINNKEAAVQRAQADYYPFYKDLREETIDALILEDCTAGPEWVVVEQVPAKPALPPPPGTIFNTQNQQNPPQVWRVIAAGTTAKQNFPDLHVGAFVLIHSQAGDAASTDVFACKWNQVVLVYGNGLKK